MQWMEEEALSIIVDWWQLPHSLFPLVAMTATHISTHVAFMSGRSQVIKQPGRGDYSISFSCGRSMEVPSVHHDRFC